MEMVRNGDHSITLSIKPSWWVRVHADSQDDGMLKACDGYENQACEHPEWEIGETLQFLNALRDALIRCLGGYPDGSYLARGTGACASMTVAQS